MSNIVFPNDVRRVTERDPFFPFASREEKVKAKRTFKKMIFMYMALLNGWQIHMLHDGKFQLSRAKPVS